MGSARASGPPDYWGYLIESDKSPSVIFQQLLLGIANYINRHVAPWNVDSLTPPKLAAFYRLLGGDYDPLFLETPHASLSFIYQSLGCFHTLQQEKSPYTTPSVPALTPHGFVRWQTVQVLLEPDQHVSYLQNAVKRLEIINPADGTLFPSLLPREALPSRCDPELVQWHDGVARKLMLDSCDVGNQGLPASRHPGIGDDATTRSITSSIDDHSTETARYFAHPRPRPPFRPPPSIMLPQAIDAPSGSSPNVPPPWDLERRRSSASDVRPVAASSWPRDKPSHSNLRRAHPPSPSTISTSSVSSSDSSVVSSSASVSPRRGFDRHHVPQHRHHDLSQLQCPYHHTRRHSSHMSLSSREVLQLHGAPGQPAADGDCSSQRPTCLAGAQSRGLNVRWEVHPTPHAVRRPQTSQNGRSGPSSTELQDHVNGRSPRSRSGSEGRSASPLRGVGGRRYASERVDWN